MFSCCSDAVTAKDQNSKGQRLSATRVDRLDDVKNLNVWGRHLTDVSILNQMPNIEVLSLSINKITSLKDFKHCKKISELYLRKNDILDINEVLYLKDMSNLKILWLNENPCARDPDYRMKVLSVLRNLDKLDDQDVASAEREVSLSYKSKLKLAEQVDETDCDTMKQYDVQQQERPSQSVVNDVVNNAKRSKWQRDSPVDVPFMRDSGNARMDVESVRNQTSNIVRPDIAPPAAPVPSLLLHNLPEFDDEGNLVQGYPHLIHQSPQRHNNVPPRVLQPQQQQQPQVQPQPPSHQRTNQRTNNNVLTAVLALIQELDQDALTIVQAQISRLMP